MDKTVKIMLLVIIVLLSALLIRSTWDPTPAAQAATVSAKKVSQDYYATKMISVLERTDIKAVHIVDSAQSFILELDDGLEIYRIQGSRITLTDNTD